MVYRLQRSGLVWLGVGLCLGLVFAGIFPHTPLHATSNDRYDDFAIATGAVDESTEAIYFLDFLTGDLKAAAVGPLRKFARALSDQHPQRSGRRQQQGVTLHDGHRHGAGHSWRPWQRPPCSGHPLCRQLQQRPHRPYNFAWDKTPSTWAGRSSDNRSC